MRPIPIRYCLLCLLMLGGITVFGQGSVVSVAPNTGYPGQTVTLIITGTGTDFTTASEAGIYRAFPDWYRGAGNGLQTEITPTFTIPISAPTGPYTVDVKGNWPFVSPIPLANGFNVLDISGNAGRIRGKVHREVNIPDCAFSVGDQLIDQAVVEVLPGPYYALTDNLGNFTAVVPAGTYSVNVVPPLYHVPRCPTAAYTVTVAGASDNPGYDFWLEQRQLVDIEACVIPNPHRPGIGGSGNIQVRNFGGDTEQNFTVKMVFPSVFSLMNAAPSPNSISNDTATWNLGPIGPNEIQYISFNVSIPVNTPLGATVHYETILIAPNDVNPANDHCAAGVPITASYDPNDKRVWTQDNVNADGRISLSDTLLRYHIRFQNTGTDTAFTVVLRDTFDSNLDLSTLTMRQSSHPYFMEIDSANGYLTWTFNNILLVDSTTNEPGSHGHLIYTIKPKAGLSLGTEIRNAAGIYFDFNPPVQTNTVVSRICPPLDVHWGYVQNFQHFTFDDLTTGNVTSWNWNFGDGTTSTLQDPQHTYSAPGEYIVCLSAGDTCGFLDACFVVTVDTLVGQEAPWLSEYVDVYPNPVADRLYVALKLPQPRAVSLHLYDAIGRKVRQLPDRRLLNGRLAVETADLPQGTYFLEIRAGADRMTKTIYIE